MSSSYTLSYGNQQIKLVADPNQAGNYIMQSASSSSVNNISHNGSQSSSAKPTGELFLKFKADTPESQCQEIIQKHGLTIKETRTNNQFICTSDRSVAVCADLQKEPQVQTAEPDLSVPISRYTP